jgi:chromodomain-helicase-DNA-binding protein 1
MEETLLDVSDLLLRRVVAYQRSFASYFWPREGVAYTKLMDIHKKLVGLILSVVELKLIHTQVNESSPAPTSAPKAKSKPKPKRKSEPGDAAARPKKKAKAEVKTEVKEEAD